MYHKEVVLPHRQPRSEARGARSKLALRVKRLTDVVGASAGLALLSPVMVATGVAIKVSMGGGVFFRQRRPGLRGEAFTLVKFRTMSDARDENGALLPDVQRLTRLGGFLRRSSLDELPTLWNVLKGDMSLVGPRPLLVRYLDRYTAEQARRHDVKPGITGWAQINGRNAPDWETKLAHDVWYAEHWSLWLDAKILAKTLGKVIFPEGVSHRGEATMPEFMGSQRHRGDKAAEETNG